MAPPSRSPLRKPVPSSYHPPPQHLQQQQQQQQQNERLAPLTQINPSNGNSKRASLVASPPAQSQPQFYASQAPPQPQQQHPAQSNRTHAHSRTVSSAALASPDPAAPSSPPSNPSPPSSRGTMSYQQQQQYANSQYPPQPTARRTLSNATTSTSSTGGRKASFGGTSLSRTTSSRSTSSNSYVALMRRQKATVWSDRAQFEDPRHIAQQKAAKMRAAMDLSGSHAHSLGGYPGGVRSKIRTHGVQKAQQYTPMAHPASGVPMRLSAREVEDDDSDDEHLGVRASHIRSGSGRSSTGSNGRLSSIYAPGTTTPPGVTTAQRGSVATGPTATSSDSRPRADTQSTVRSDAEPTPVPGNFQSGGGGDYFSGTKKQASTPSSEEDAEAGFGRVGGLPQRVKNLALDDKTAEDLQRRGSVDERTTTMRGYGRLFVANPDLSD